MKLLSLFKCICIAYGFVFINFCAMDITKTDIIKDKIIKPLSLEELKKFENQGPFRYKHTAKKFVREFPLMSPKLIEIRYSLCNENEKRKIYKKFYDKNEGLAIDEKFVAEKGFFFRLVGCLEIVINSFSGGGFAYDACKMIPFDILTGNFNQVYKDYLLVKKEWPKKYCIEFINTQECMNQKQRKGEDCVEQKSMEYDTQYMGCAEDIKRGRAKDIIEKVMNTNFIFRYIDQLKLFSGYAYNTYSLDGNVSCGGKKFLEFLFALNAEIKKVDNNAQLYFYQYSESGGCEVPYKEYKSYSLINFLKTFKISNFKEGNRKYLLNWYIFCIVPILTRWLSSYIEFNHCQKSLTMYEVYANDAARIFNEGLKQAQGQEISIDPHCILPYLKTKFKSPELLIEPYYDGFDLFKMYSIYCIPGFLYNPIYTDYLFDWFRKSVWALVFGSLSYYIIPNFVGLSVGISLLFFILILFENISDMRAIKISLVKLDDIPVLLKRHNDGEIVIV